MAKQDSTGRPEPPPPSSRIVPLEYELECFLTFPNCKFCIFFPFLFSFSFIYLFEARSNLTQAGLGYLVFLPLLPSVGIIGIRHHAIFFLSFLFSF